MSQQLMKELVLLVLQYFHEENFNEAARMLGRESGLFFDMNYFEEMVLEGQWEEAENYLSGFTKVMDNKFSIKMYFEMRKQKYFEALDDNHHHKALDILLKDLKVFTEGNEVLFKDLSYLLVLDNIRNLKTTYKDSDSARKDLMVELKKIITRNPLLGGKLKFPLVESHRLRHLLNESLRWQRLQNPNQEPYLLMEHFNSIPFASAPTNPGTTMEWNPSTIEWPNKNFDERLYNLVLGGVKPYSIEESHNKSSNLFEICTPSQCQFLKLPSRPEVTQIVKLAYNNAGYCIVALASNGVHQVWRWPREGFNLDGKASVQFCPPLWQPRDGPECMMNDLLNIRCENPLSCFALTNGYMISTSGGMVSLFNTVTFKTLTTIMSPPPMVTSLAYNPKDNNIFAIGFDDSTIILYHVRQSEVLFKLEGHSARVTALAFSNALNILVSGDANAQIILWNTDGWKKVKDAHLHVQGIDHVVPETQIQFHPNQINFLVVHHSHLAIYETTELTCVKQWVREVPMLISQATFSSDGHNVYCILVDGTVAIFDASNFQIRCKIYRSCYLPAISSWRIYPVSVAANPQKPTQFAIGLSDGSVYVFEPSEPRNDWINNH